MKGNTPKVLRLLNHEPMLIHVLNTAASLSPNQMNLIVGYQKEKVIDTVQEWQRKTLTNGMQVRFITQKEQLGTGHAVLSAKDYLDQNDNVMVLLGDVPLIEADSLEKGLDVLNHKDADCVVLTTELNSPFGYGRIIRNSEGHIVYIREEKDASETEKLICEINTGIFLFRGKALWENINKLESSNQSSELYLTDMVSILKTAGHSVTTLKIENSKQFMGVNSPEQLLDIEQELPTI